MAKHTARHRAATQSHTLRNTGIAAAAGAVVLGSVAPANAYAGAATTYTENTSYTQQYTAEQSTTTQYTGQLASTQSTTAQQTSTQNVTGSRAAVVAAAYDGLGGSYVWGGKSYKAWDCSGFVSYAYKQAGVDLTAYTYAMKGEVRSTGTPQPGDIVFTNGYAHVGIYVGNGKMISALNPGQGTQLTAVDGGGMMPIDGYYTAL